MLSLLPLRALYMLSDFLAWLIHRVAAYRVKVVRKNLAESFPGRDARWLAKVERDFYHWLCDYFMETVKLTTMSGRQMARRMTFHNLEPVAKALREGRNVTLYLGHFCNWEWVSSLPMHLGGAPNARFGQIYHPLENEGADLLFFKIRGRFGATSIPLNDTLQTLLGWKRDGHPSIVGYIADQTPNFNSIHLWLDFLRHDTPVFTGPERISRMLHTEVYYVDMTRPRRGYYSASMVKIADDAAALEKFELTRIYYDCLQRSIENDPPLWLWSHRRWKRTRELFMERFTEKEAIRQQSRL